MMTMFRDSKTIIAISSFLLLKHVERLAANKEVYHRRIYPVGFGSNLNDFIFLSTCLFIIFRGTNRNFSLYGDSKSELPFKQILLYEEYNIVHLLPSTFSPTSCRCY